MSYHRPTGKQYRPHQPKQCFFSDGEMIYKERYFTLHPAFNYWHVEDLVSTPNPIQWGFDSTSVTSPMAWKAFLSKHHFKLIASKPEYHGHAPRIYRNPSGIFIVTSLEQSNEAEYFLGYVRFEAPSTEEDQLIDILQSFRGPTAGESGGITQAVKEETPYKASFI